MVQEVPRGQARVGPVPKRRRSRRCSRGGQFCIESLREQMQIGLALHDDPEHRQARPEWLKLRRGETHEPLLDCAEPAAESRSRVDGLQCLQLVRGRQLDLQPRTRGAQRGLPQELRGVRAARGLVRQAQVEQAQLARGRGTVRVGG